MAAAALGGLPLPALAEVCDKLRPAWNPSSGPLGALGEMAYVAGSLPGMVLLTLFALAMWRGWRWLLAIVSFAALALAALIYIGAGAPTRAEAMAEGCVGSAYPVAAVLAALAVLAFVRFWQKLG
jgi:hypothetical protein